MFRHDEGRGLTGSYNDEDSDTFARPVFFAQMFRVGLTFCLVVTTVAGPWLCCCAPDRIVSRASAVISGLGHVPLRCGCDSRFGHRPEHGRQDRHPRHPMPEPCDCLMDAPAKDDSSAAEWTDAARFARDISETSAWANNGLAAVSVDRTLSLTAADMCPRVASAFPRLCARAILSAIQLFRC
ncbi:MAG: hypothetical protein U0746_10380 [Gemmataceae bacterium]